MVKIVFQCVKIRHYNINIYIYIYSEQNDNSEIENDQMTMTANDHNFSMNLVQASLLSLNHDLDTILDINTLGGMFNTLSTEVVDDNAFSRIAMNRIDARRIVVCDR